MSIGDLLRKARKANGWTQADLAAQLGGVVGQQTVSRWEQGRSTPSRENIHTLALLFGADEGAWLNAAGHTLAEIDPAVRPLVSTLPLHELHPDVFERFCADLMQLLHPEADVSLYGSRGHTQDGIDGLITRPDQSRWTFQCKRHQQFGPADVRTAVEAVGVDADKNVLMLSRVASPGAREEIGNHRGWALWDSEDLARKIRHELPVERAVRLVDTYFPGHRQPFLGIAEPGPWLTTDEAYRHLESNDLFKHSWSLVGRQSVLASIQEFATTDTDRIGLLIGRGGLGKSRLLREVARSLESERVEVRFLERSTGLRPEHFETLPSQTGLVIVVDDAHEREDIGALLTGVARRRPGAKILLALRPHGMTTLARDLSLVSAHHIDLPTWKLSDLSPDEARELALEALGDAQPDEVGRRLAAVSTDCPLVAVLGGVLIRDGRLRQDEISSHESIREVVLAAFQDAIASGWAAGDAALRQAVLDAISALQPFRADQPEFRSALEELTGVAFDRALPHIRGLEDSGVLLRRGNAIRVVPDLLGDVVLSRAAVDERSGLDSGYVHRVLGASQGAALDNLLVNIARLDWQTSSGGTRSEAAWEPFFERFRDAGIRGRIQLLKTARRVAYYQPERAIELVGWAMTHPTQELEVADGLLNSIYAPTAQTVMEELPGILRNASYHFDHLPAVLNLLWELARSDERQPNQFSDHPLRVLQDLAGYDDRKPLPYLEAVVDAIERWLASAQPGPWSPFDVAEKLLATEGYDTSFSGHQFTMRPYLIRADVVVSIRERVIDLAIAEARSLDPYRAARGIRAIEAGVRYPHGFFGRQVSQDERDGWTPQFVRTIERLGEIALDPAIDPTVKLAIRHALRWHAEHSTTTTGAAARAAVAAIPDDDVQQLALYVHDGWGHLTDDHDAAEDYREAAERRQRSLTEFVDVLRTRRPPSEILGLLTERLAADAAAFSGEGPSSNPDPLIAELVEQEPQIGILMCHQLAADPGSALRRTGAVALATLARAGQPIAMEMAHLLVEAGLDEEVAHSFGWIRGGRTRLLEGEAPLLARLARHPNPQVRTSIAQGLQALASSSAAAAIELLAEIRFEDSAAVASEVMRGFGTYGQLGWDDVPGPLRERVFAQLTTCPTIEDHRITNALENISKAGQASEVVALLQRRVELAESPDTPDRYDALPFDPASISFAGYEEQVAILREICDWTAEAPDSWRRPELYFHVASSVEGAALDVLDEYVTSGRLEEIETVTRIVADAPKNVTWDRVDFVTRLLHAASRQGEETLRAARSALHRSAVSGVRSGRPGEPYPEDVRQRDTAAAIAANLPRGSVEEAFYLDIESSAVQSIRWSTERDEHLSDGRDW